MINNSKFGHETTKHLGASRGELHRDDEKFPVYLLTTGKFATPWGGLFLAKDSLKALDRAIAKLKAHGNDGKVLILFRAEKNRDADKEFKLYRAIEWKKNKIVLDDGNSLGIGYGTVYVYDAAIAAKLLKMDAEIEKVEAKLKDMCSERNNVSCALTVCHSYDFDALMGTHGTTPNGD